MHGIDRMYTQNSDQNLQGKRQLGISRERQDNNIKLYLMKTGCEEDGMHSAVQTESGDGIL
jgi:hypothetical protein